jgi:hypothetical protein
MKLDDIMSHWEKDSSFDRTELGEESLKTPKLHQKYYKIYVQERLQLQKLESEYKELYKLKFEYFMGSIADDDLKEHGWHPNPLKILRQDMPMHMDADQDIIAISLRMGLQNEKIDYVKSILSMINNRGFQIKNAIDFEKFKNGL